MNKTTIAAIEFGTSKIVTVIARCGNNEKIELAGTGTVPYDGFKDGDWNTPGQMIQRVHDSIAAAELEAHEKVSEIYVGVPGEYVRVRGEEAEIDLGGEEVTALHKALVQDAAAEKLQIAETGDMVLHRSPAWFQVDDGKMTMDPAGHGGLLRAGTSFILADMQFIEDTKEILGALDITILGYLSTTLGEALLLPSADDRDRICALIDCGYLSTEVSVVRGDAIIYHAMLPMGGGQITADLAMELRIPMRAAEQLKRGFSFTDVNADAESTTEVRDARGRNITFPVSDVARCVEASMAELTKMLDMTLTEAESLFTARSQIYITGGGINEMPGIETYIEDKLGRPCKFASPKTSSGALSVRGVKTSGPAFSSVHGLIDLIFNCIQLDGKSEDTFGKKLTSFLKRGR